MELVYLWVEKYKNIKKQGFNFSPRFDSEYDEKSNELTITEKKDYVSIFPDNINITAIVGENGSGKSSVLFQEFNNINDLRIIFKSEILHIYDPYLLVMGNSNEPKINFTKINNNTKYELKFHSDEVLESDLDEYKLRNENYDIDYSGEDTFYDTKCTYNLSNSIYFNWDLLKYNNYEEFINEFMYNETQTDPNILVPIIETSDSSINYKFFYKKLNQKLFFHYDNILFDNLPFYPYYIRLNFEQKEDKFNKLISLLDNSEVIVKNNDSYMLRIDSFKKTIYNKLNNEINNFVKTELISIEYLDEKKRILFDLSYGERSLFIIFILLITEISNKDNNLMLFLDEIDLGIHPNWQKGFLSKLLNTFRKLNKNIHILVTSHSPFLLSDLPKENVIFLDKFSENDDEVKNRTQIVGNCKNISNAISIEQTFGANIHTLLANGFFMSDGLMGEFAKGKIEEIKKFYELVQRFEEKIKLKQKPFVYIEIIYLLKIKKFRHIQSIIGEPFLQTIIKNYLDELDILFNGKKQFLDTEIKRLQDLRDKS